MQLERQIHAGGDAVVDRAEVPDPALRVEDVVLHERVAEALYRRALVLHLDLERVQRLADVGHGHVADDGDGAGPFVDFGFDRGAVELEEGRRTGQRMRRIALLAALAVSDELAAEPPEPRLEDLEDRQVAAWQVDDAAVDGDRLFWDVVEPGGDPAQLGLDRAARLEYGVAHQDGRAAGRCLLIVWDRRRVAHDDGDPVQRRPELLAHDLRKDRPGALAHVRCSGVDDRAPVGEEPHRRVGEAGGGPGLETERNPTAVAGRERRIPPDGGGGSLHCLLPVAVGWRVEWDEGIAFASEVAEADREAVDPQCSSGFVEVRLYGPVDLGIAEATESRRRRGVGKDAAAHDPDGRNVVGSGGRIAAFAYHSVGDVGVRAYEVVRLDILEGEGPVAAHAGADADLA